MSTAVAPGMPPAHGGFQRPGKGKADPDERERETNGFLSSSEEEEEGDEAVVRREEKEEEAAARLSDCSSIGAASSDSSSIGDNSASEKEDGEEDEVQSKAKELAGLESLEDALPSKRGLSNFYAGKSKSFTCLAEASAKAAAKEIAKPENPFNKRRRVLAAWSRRRASCSALAATYLPPLLGPDHAVLEEDDEDEEGGREARRPPSFPSPRLSAHAQQLGRNPNAGSFRSPRSFSMTDLQSASYDLAEN